MITTPYGFCQPKNLTQPFGKLGHTGFMPFSGDILEALAFGCDSGLFGLPLLLGRINAFGQ